MKQLEIKNYRLDMAKHCFISRGKLNYLLANKYGRDSNKTCIKVFDLEEIRHPDDFYKIKWGDDSPKGSPRLNTELFEATQIQNICAMYDLAPRVYGLETVSISIDNFCPAQFCEYVEGMHPESDVDAIDVYNVIRKLGINYGFTCDKPDVSCADVINGKLIDFQTLAFEILPYQDTVKEIYIEKGKYGKVYYQNVPELGLTGGPRDESRLKFIENIDFKDKTVLDIGCAGGMFCRYADDKGAKSVIGYDYEKQIEAAKHLANYLGYFNLDFYAAHEGIPKVKYDIVFMLSINMHMPSWESIIERILDKDSILIFEKNGNETDEEIEAKLKDLFNDVKLVGRSTDQAICQKPFYICRDKK